MSESPTDSFSKILGGSENVDDFLRGLEGLSNRLPSRVNADPQNVEKGLARLVLTRIDLGPLGKLM
jgi:hypothetical protein